MTKKVFSDKIISEGKLSQNAPDCQLDTAIGTATVVRRDGGTETGATRRLLREHSLELLVDGQFVAQLVCTCNALEDLAVGRLTAEGIVSEMDEIKELCVSEDNGQVRVSLRENAKGKNLGGNAAFSANFSGALKEPGRYSPLSPASWRPEWIFGLADAFAEDSKLHRSTNGTHTCMLAREGEILYRTEDISRHNAVDKAVGFAVREGLDRSRCILFTTGRVPADMVQKAIMARIPVLVSKSVPTREAVELAEAYGLQLICKAWPDSYEICNYSEPCKLWHLS